MSSGKESLQSPILSALSHHGPAIAFHSGNGSASSNSQIGSSGQLTPKFNSQISAPIEGIDTQKMPNFSFRVTHCEAPIQYEAKCPSVEYEACKASSYEG